MNQLPSTNVNSSEVAALLTTSHNQTKQGLEHYLDDSDNSSCSSSSSWSLSATMSFPSSSLPLPPPDVISISPTTSNTTPATTPTTSLEEKRKQQPIKRMPSAELQSEEEEAIMSAAAALSSPQQQQLRKSLTSLSTTTTTTTTPRPGSASALLRRSSSKLSVASISSPTTEMKKTVGNTNTTTATKTVIRKLSRRFSSPANVTSGTTVRRRRSLPLSSALDQDEENNVGEKLNDSWGSNLAYDSEDDESDSDSDDEEEEEMNDAWTARQIESVIGTGAAAGSLPKTEAAATTTATSPNESDKFASTTQKRWSFSNNNEKDNSRIHSKIQGARQRYLIKTLQDCNDDIENGNNNPLLNHPKNPFLNNSRSTTTSSSSRIELQHGDEDQDENNDDDYDFKIHSSKTKPKSWRSFFSRFTPHRSTYEKTNNKTCCGSCTTTTNPHPRRFCMTISLSLTELLQIFLLLSLLYLMYDSKTKIDLATSSLTQYQSEERVMNTQLLNFQNRAKELNDELDKLSKKNQILEAAVAKKQLQGKGVEEMDEMRKLRGSTENNGGDRRKGRMRMALDDDTFVDSDEEGTIATADAAAKMRAKRQQKFMEQQQQDQNQ